ncbi:hypothetical protein FS749_010658 [Ceratobasidium sp. UAMH 11750]|nr:hypothetical protein FS749_010658 [Ceratobasidium sp. UAMH 11750]
MSQTSNSAPMLSSRTSTPESAPVPAPTLVSASTPARGGPVTLSAPARISVLVPSAPMPAPVLAPTLPFPIVSTAPSSVPPVPALAPPPYAPPHAPAPTNPAASSNVPAFANYQVFNHRACLHEGGLSVMAISTGGKWLFTSANDQERKCFALTNALNLTLSLVVNTGKAWATAAFWVSDDEFYVGFNDGRVYNVWLQKADVSIFHSSQERNLTLEQLVAKLTWLATIKHKDLPNNSITSIAFSTASGYLAFSTCRGIHIFQRLDYDATSFNRGETDVSKRYRVVTTILPFTNTEPNINSLTFYGLSRVNLVVGASAGLLVYSMYPKEPRIIAATYEYQVSQCGISSDGHVLAASTSEGYLVYWPLTITGPVFQVPTIIVAPIPMPTRPSSSLPSISITPTNIIVGAMQNGHIFIAKPSTKEKHLIRLDSQKLNVKAVAAHGNRFYIACANSFSRSTEIVAYSLIRADLELAGGLLGQPRAFSPRVNLLSELTNELPEVEPTPSQVRPRVAYFLAYLFLFSCLTVIVIILAGLWRQCIAPLADLQTDESVNPYGTYIAHAWLCMVNYHVPRGLISYASYVLVTIISVLQLVLMLS